MTHAVTVSPCPHLMRQLDFIDPSYTRGIVTTTRQQLGLKYLRYTQQRLIWEFINCLGKED